MHENPAEFYRSLRISTAALLGYGDVDHLTSEQAIRTDRALTLRLVVDHLQGRQMQGQQIDVKEFVAASESLERMVTGADPEQNTGPDYDAARHKVETMISNLIAADEHKMAQDPAAARAKFEEKLQRAIENNDPGGGGERDGDGKPLSSPLPAVVAGCGSEPLSPMRLDGAPATPTAAERDASQRPPKAPEPQPQPPAQTSPQPPLLPPDAPIPACYLKGPPEPWRAWVDENGIRSSPVGGR